jgi:hypothetical protein
VENDTSEKVTIENPILSNIDDEFPTIDIISPLKSPVKSAAVAQDVDKSLKPKYKAKDFHKIRKKFIVCSSFPFFLSHSPLLIVFLFFHFFLPFMDFFVPVLFSELIL